MKKITLTLFCLILLTSAVFSQATLETVRAGRKVQHELTLFVKGDASLDFVIDKSTTFKTLDTVDYFQGRDREFRVYIEFVNPLRYRISSENTSIEDELYKASNEYLTNVISFFQTIGAVEESVDAGLRGAPTKVATKGKQYVFKDPALAELFILIKLAFPKYFDTDKDSVLTAMENFDFEVTKVSVQAEIDKTFKALVAIDKLADINTTLTSNEALWKNIDASIKKLEDRFTKVKDLLALEPFNSDQNIKNVVMFRVNSLGKEVSSFKETINGVKTKYGTVKSLFDGILKMKPEGNRFLLFSITDLKAERRHELKVTLQKVEFNLSDKTMKLGEKKNFLMHIRRYHLLIPIVSTGLLYSNLKFVRFGTDTNGSGELIVTETKEDANEVITGGFMNLFFNYDLEMSPFLQFGVGPSSEKPIMFFGGGVSLNNRVNIAVGTVFTWFPELSGLKVGDVVTGTSQITEATVYKLDFNRTFYIGINVNLSSNK